MAAVVWVQSLSWEISHFVSVAKKKKKKEAEFRDSNQKSGCNHYSPFPQDLVSYLFMLVEF